MADNQGVGGGDNIEALNRSKPFNTDYNNWYKSFPYTFVHTNKFLQVKKFALPISPSNLTVVTQYATNVVATLYGTVEEHSEVRYFDINITGNTGFGPKYVGAESMRLIETPGRTQTASVGRDSFTNGSTLSATLESNGLAATVGEGVTNESGIDAATSGYAAFHNLYKFFLRYKEDTSGVPMNKFSAEFAAALALQATRGIVPNIPRFVYPLRFLNYKDGLSYDVIPISFTLVRSAENPMLYSYAIRLRGMNLQNVYAAVKSENMLSELGLTGVSNNASVVAGSANNITTTTVLSTKYNGGGGRGGK